MRRARSRSPRDRVSQALAITRCDFKNVPDRSISTQPHTHGSVARCASIAGLQELYAAPKRSREQRPTAYRLGPRLRPKRPSANRRNRIHRRALAGTGADRRAPIAIRAEHRERTAMVVRRRDPTMRADSATPSYGAPTALWRSTLGENGVRATSAGGRAPLHHCGYPPVLR